MNNIGKEKIWKAAVYTRLSKEDGDKIESDSIQSQHLIIQDFLKNNPDIVIEKEFADDGFSGINFNRPGYSEMQEGLINGTYDCVIVKDISRLSRNKNDLGNLLEQIYPLLKIRFISVNENVDSYINPDSVYKLDVTFKALFNDYYVMDFSVRTKSALTARRKAGKFIGSQASYGYLKDKEDHNKLIIDEYASQIVKFVFNGFLSGKSMRSIAMELNSNNILTPSKYKLSIGINDGRAYLYDKTTWDSTNIKRILTNQMYVGDMVQAKSKILNYKTKKLISNKKEDYIVVENTHEAIVSKNDYFKVQSMLKRDTRICMYTEEPDIFSGFIKCGDCKRGMNKKHINNGFKNYYYYVCSTFKKKGKTECTKHAIRRDLLIESVFAAVKTMIMVAVNFGDVVSKINESSDRIYHSDKLEKNKKQVTNDIAKLRQKLIDAYEDFRNDIISNTTYLSLKNKYDQTIASKESELNEIVKSIEKIKSGVTQENRFINNFKRYENITELTRDVVVELIENIYIFEKNKITIKFNFEDEFKIAYEYIAINKRLENIDKNINNLQMTV